MLQFLQELRLSFRTIRRSPGLAGIAVLALILGVGLTTTMFSIVNGAVLQGLPFPESDRLLHIEATSVGADSLNMTIHDYRDVQSQQSVFEDIAGFYEGTVYVTDDAGPMRYDGAFMSANTFSLLRAKPEIGRVFQPGEDDGRSELVVILGYRIWQDRYEGRSDVLGKAFRVNGEVGTVIGVMPEGFRFPLDSYIWLPLRMDPLTLERGEGQTLELMGRLGDGRTEDEAMVELSAIADRLEEDYPKTNKGMGIAIQPYITEFLGEEPIAMLWVMLGAVFGVLLIACANVANLLLARASMRVREVTLRSALGASRPRIIVSHLAESLSLALLGGLGGLLLSRFGIRLFNEQLLSSAPGVPFWFDITLNPRVATFVVVITAASAILAGILPALQASKVDLNGVLKDESRGSSGLRIGKLSRALVIAEVMLSCALLVSAGLMIKSVMNLNAYEPEFATDTVLTARVGLFDADYPDATDRRGFYRELQRRLEGVSGVESAAVSSGLPAWGTGSQAMLVEGVAYGEPNERPRAGRFVVSPRYFDTYEIPIEEGRDFFSTDDADSEPVAIVSQSFATRFLDGDALGRRFRADEEDTEWRTVVGVVPDLSQMGNFEPMYELWYEPVAQADMPFASMSVRTSGDPHALSALVRDEVSRMDANLPIYWVFTMQEQVDRQTWFYSVFGTLFAIFGAVALFLAAIGLYAVISFSVSRRTQEIGVRMAIGANARQVLRLVLRQGLNQLAIGIVFGLGIALVLSRAMVILLFQLEPWDPFVFGAILLVLTAVGLLATLVPALRATRVNPVSALHYE